MKLYETYVASIDNHSVSKCIIYYAHGLLPSLWLDLTHNDHCKIVLVLMNFKHSTTAGKSSVIVTYTYVKWVRGNL